MALNYTNLTSQNSMADWGGFLLQHTNNWFGISIVITIFAISFIVSKRYPLNTALITSSGITSILSLLLWGLGWVPFFVMILAFVAFGLSVALSKMLEGV